jgi:hypothetical protein
MGAEIKEVYFVPTKGGLELIAIAEAEEDALAAILCAINGNGHIEEEAVRIMTPEEMDKVIERSRSVSLPKDEPTASANYCLEIHGPVRLLSVH